MGFAGTIMMYGGRDFLTSPPNFAVIFLDQNLVLDVQQQLLPVITTHSAVAYDVIRHRVYIHGGFRAQGTFQMLWEYDLETKAWTELFQLTPLGQRFGHFAHIVNDTLIFGLGSSSISLLHDICSLNLISNAWKCFNNTDSKLRRLLPAYASFSQSHASSLMGMFGGLRIPSIDEILDEIQILDDFWILDGQNSTNLTWTRVIHREGPWPPRRFLSRMTSFVTTSNRTGLFMYGGITGDSEITDYRDVKILDDAWVYWLDESIWMDVSQIIDNSRVKERVGHTVMFVAGHIVLTGGATSFWDFFDILFSVLETTPKMEVFSLRVDLLESLWTKNVGLKHEWQSVAVAQMEGRFHHITFTFNRTLFVWGGRSTSTIRPPDVISLELVCSPGFFSLSGKFDDCQPCPHGQFQSSVNAVECLSCDAQLTTHGTGV